MHRDHSDVLAVCDWNQRLSFYQPSGRQVRDLPGAEQVKVFNATQIGKERTLGYDACFLDYFINGEYMIIGGSNKQVHM